MNRELETVDDLIDLGAASIETRGGLIPAPVDDYGYLPETGISND